MRQKAVNLLPGNLLGLVCGPTVVSGVCVISIKIARKSTSLSLWLSGFLQNLYEMSYLMKVTKIACFPTGNVTHSSVLEHLLVQAIYSLTINRWLDASRSMCFSVISTRKTFESVT